LRKVEFFYPTAFSPDDNQINEGFGLSPMQYLLVQDYELQVFNRWGEKVFQSKDPTDHWFGEGAQIGVYIYKALITDVYNEKHEVRGVVELIR
jgi:hypothetical protein